MTPQKNDPITSVKDGFYKWIGAAIGLVVLYCITFYFSTQAKLSEHDKELAAQSALISQMVSRDEMNELKARVREDIQSIHMDIKEVREDNKKILEILSERQR